MLLIIQLLQRPDIFEATLKKFPSHTKKNLSLGNPKLAHSVYLRRSKWGTLAEASVPLAKWDIRKLWEKLSDG